MKEIRMYVILILLAFLLSYVLTAGIVWALCWIVGAQFSLRTATTVWLILILLRSVFSR